MKNVERSDDPDLNHLKLFFYVIPIIGFFPSLWTLYHHSNQHQSSDPLLNSQVSRKLTLSRLSVTLAGCWLLGYIFLGVGAETEFLTLRFLMLNTLLTSGYFLVSIWLMFRLAAGKTARLPGLSRLAERVGKHLS